MLLMFKQLKDTALTTGNVVRRDGTSQSGRCGLDGCGVSVCRNLDLDIVGHVQQRNPFSGDQPVNHLLVQAN
jgi:hypothetical protein